MAKDYDYGQLLDDFELGADVMPGESLTDYIERRRREFESKAEGGSIGIEVLFGPKREDFNIGGQAQKKNTTPYDSRASILDYGAALDKVGAGTQAQKSQSLGQYAKNYFTGLGEAGLKKLNPSVRSLAASYGVGEPISKFSDLGPEVGQALQGAIMNTIKNSQQRNPMVNSDISLTNIPVSSYTSYFKDRGVANTAGLYDTGYNSITDQLKDMSAALAGDASAIARTTYGRFNVDIDPEARTGLIRDRYDFEKNMPGSTAYGINMALPQKFVDEILNSPEYQKATGYKPPQSDIDRFRSGLYAANQFDKTTGDRLFGGQIERLFNEYKQSPSTFFYAGDDTQNMYDRFNKYYYADGGRVGMVSGGFLKGIGSFFKAGKDKIDDIIETKAMEKVGFRSKDDIPLSTYSEMKGPIKISEMENIPEDQLKKILRTQELGLYEETPEILKAANLLERFTKKVGGKRVIDYERAEDILNVKLKGNETLDELFKIEFRTRPEMRAEGGRVGLFMGGPPLEGQALSVYESMNAYGFTDPEIANALSAQGLYTPNKTTTTTPVINKAPNIINQGGGDGGGGGGPKGGLGLSRFDYGYTSPGGEFNIDDIGEGTVADEDYTFGMRMGDLGTGIKGGIAKAYQDLRSLPTPFNIASKGLGNIKDYFKQKAEEKAAAEAAAAQTAFDQIMSSAKSQQDFYDSLNDGRGATSTAESRSTAGDAPGYSGPSTFAKGGLATMFKPRRR